MVTKGDQEFNKNGGEYMSLGRNMRKVSFYNLRRIRGWPEVCSMRR